MVLQGGTISIPWDCMRNTNPGPHRRLKGSEILGVEPSHQLHQPSRQFWSTLELENHWLRRWSIAFIEGSHRCAPAVKGVPDKKSPDLCESSWSTCLVSPEHCVRWWRVAFNWGAPSLPPSHLTLGTFLHLISHLEKETRTLPTSQDCNEMRREARLRTYSVNQKVLRKSERRVVLQTGFWESKHYVRAESGENACIYHFPRSSTFLSIQWLIHHFSGCVSDSAISAHEFIWC